MEAMRAAAPRAARRLGSSMMSFRSFAQLASSNASGTRVVLPAPGGASSTRFGVTLSDAQISGISGSIGRSVVRDLAMAPQHIAGQDPAGKLPSVRFVGREMFAQGTDAGAANECFRT